MKILHFIEGRCAPDTANGVDKVVYYLAKAQAALGHEVFVMCESAKGVIEVPGATVINTPRTRSCLRLSGHAVEVLERVAPEMIHLHSAYIPTGISVARWARRNGTCYVISPHGNYSGKLSKRRRLLKAIYKKFFELPCANGASLIHSMGDRKDIEEFGYRGAIVDIPNGYAMDAYLESSGENRVVTKIPTAKGKRQILFIGRLDLEQKGLDLLLEGFGRAEMNETVLVIVGPAWKNGLDRVKNILERSCLSEEQVIFYGAAFGQEKADLLHAADFFVHTSRWEGFPMAVIEAMAYRKVCLVTPAADPLGVLAEGGNGIPLDPNPDSIARAFKEAANLPKEKLEMMGSGVRNIVEARFSWEGVAKSMVEAYAAINSK